jgi:hypothetical protein
MRHTLSERGGQLVRDSDIGLRKDSGLHVDEQFVRVLNDRAAKAGARRSPAEVLRIGVGIVVLLKVPLHAMFPVDARHPTDAGISRRIRGQARLAGIGSDAKAGGGVGDLRGRIRITGTQRIAAAERPRPGRRL